MLISMLQQPVKLVSNSWAAEFDFYKTATLYIELQFIVSRKPKLMKTTWA